MSEIPANAPEHCPGPKSETAGNAAPCAGCPNQQVCASGAGRQVDPAIADIGIRLSTVRKKFVVLSGKGGVGKSTVSNMIARALARNSHRQVGLLDVDICGPSAPTMLGVQGSDIHQSASGWQPVYAQDNLAVMSIGFLIENNDDAVIWRGPRKNGLIKQFLRDVDWQELDVLLIDTPPGTSDEHLSIVQYLLGATQVDGAILVTGPQQVSLLDVRKMVSFCRKVNLPIVGVVENMARFVCPKCSHDCDVFPHTTGGAAQMCKEMSVELLASIPIDFHLAECCDRGEDFFEKYPDSIVARSYLDLLKKIQANDEMNTSD